MFLKKIPLVSNTSKISSELNTILDINPWGNDNQIGIKHRVNHDNKWKDAIGSLYDRTNNIKLGSESDFTEWAIDESWYIRQQIEILENTLGIKTGRVRFMNLLPHRGLSVHKDEEVRYHLAIKTNPNCFISLCASFAMKAIGDFPASAVCYNIPHDNNWYQVDTRHKHWVYNGSNENRIHLVVCGT